MLRLLILNASASSASCWPRPEPVAETPELRLVDRRQDYDHCRLDDLILNRGNAEQSLPAIRLRYVRPAGGQRPIRSSVDAPMEIVKIAFARWHLLGAKDLIKLSRHDQALTWGNLCARTDYEQV
jgi:hypothetical protein